MMSERKRWLWQKILPLVLILGGIGTGILATMGGLVLDQLWLAILALVGLAVIFPWFVKAPERWLFAVLVLSLPFSARLRFGASSLHPGGAEAAIAPLDFPLLALVALYVLKDLKAGKIVFYNGTVERRLLLFGAMGGLSLFNAVDPSFVVYEILRIVKIILLIYCTKRFVRGYREVTLVLYLLVFDVFSQSILGLMQLALGRSLGLFILGEADALWLDISVEGAVSRVGGTLGHANAMALFLEMTLPLIFSLALTKGIIISASRRFFFLATFVLGVMALVFTFSRSAWVSLFAALILVLLFYLRHLRLTVGQSIIIGAGGMTSLSALVALREPILRRLFASSSASFTFRENLITIALNMLRRHPWLGVGLNNFVLVMANYDTTGLTERRLTPVHNLYFLTAAETGILGLAAFLWLLIGVFAESWQTLRAKEPLLTSCVVGILAGLAAALIHSNLGWLWRYDVDHMAFWFLVAFALAIKNLAVSLSAPGQARCAT